MPAGDTPKVINDLISDAGIPVSVAVSDIADPLFAHNGVTVQLLRLDQIDPVLSGNKLFKLIPNLIAARASGFDTVLSFGGAYSNHIHALAEAGYRYNFRTIGVIRGDDGQADSHTLKFAASRGMQLIRVSRQDYRRRHDQQFADELARSLGEFYLIPEGGANPCGIRGSMLLADVIASSLRDQPPGQRMPDEILLACGTGTTMAGLIAGLMKSARLSVADKLPCIRGIAVLKQGEFLCHDIAHMIDAMRSPDDADVSWQLETTCHWGGYARFPEALAQFVSAFEHRHGILLDPVYTAKLMSAVYQRIEAGLYAPGTRLLLLHTGGLQGRRPDAGESAT